MLRWTTGKRYNGDDNDNCLASAPNGSYDGKRRRNNGNNGGDGGDGGDDNDITATLQQLQDDTHDDEGYRVCVRIRALRDHEGLMGANQVQTR